jgi:hypothetical protein
LLRFIEPDVKTKRASRQPSVVLLLTSPPRIIA